VSGAKRRTGSSPKSEARRRLAGAMSPSLQRSSPRVGVSCGVLYAAAVAPFWTSSACLDPASGRGSSLGYRSPPSFDEGSSSLGASPFQSVRLLSPAGSCRRFDSQRFRVPSTTSLGLAPYEPECPHPARFRSQVFSTSQRFPSTPELCGLVACRCRPWDPSLQSFPLVRIACPSRGCLLPCSHPPAC